ncbi:MAG: chloride channel protein, partial [Candidatus Methanomethylicaceae archaeon]
LVGLATVAVYLLHNLLWSIRNLFVSQWEYSAILFAVAGLLGAYLILRVLTGRAEGGCGTHKLLEAYHYSGGVLSERNTLGSTLASVTTIGLGGSAGLEGPSLLLGGGIASSIGRRLGLEPLNMRIYLLSGAAAGLSAIFKAPLTGILFALEIPYQRDLAKDAFIPATFSSLIAYFVSVGLLGPQHIFPYVPEPLVSSPTALLHGFLLGILAALTGRFFVFTYRWLGEKVPYPRIYGPIIGGAVIGAIGLFAPQVMGLGYGAIDAVLSGEFDIAVPVYILAILILKIVATSVTLRMGGTGGVFIPSIFVGAFLGLLYSKILYGTTDVSLVMAAMAAVMAATNKTLLAGVAFVAETVGPSSLIVSLVSATTSYFASGRSTFFKEVQPVKEPGKKEKSVSELYHIMNGKVGVLDSIKVSDVMTKDPVVLSENGSVLEYLRMVREHGHRVYPVVDSNGHIMGYVALEDLLVIPEDKWGLRIDQTLMRVPLLIRKDESLRRLVSKMIEVGADHAFVVEDDGKLVGVVATTDILRRLLEAAQLAARVSSDKKASLENE